jgi:hypothetical protein
MRIVTLSRFRSWRTQNSLLQFENKNMKSKWKGKLLPVPHARTMPFALVAPILRE